MRERLECCVAVVSAHAAAADAAERKIGHQVKDNRVVDHERSRAGLSLEFVDKGLIGRESVDDQRLFSTRGQRLRAMTTTSFGLPAVDYFNCFGFISHGENW